MPRFYLLSGHGRWDGRSVFTVPAGKRVHFLVRHGWTMYDFHKLNKAIGDDYKKHKDPDVLYSTLKNYVVETIEGGESCFDYHLFRPRGLTKFKNHKLVLEMPTETKLSVILGYSTMKDITDVFWYACRGFDTWTGGITMEEARHGLTISAATSIERMLANEGSSPKPQTDWEAGFTWAEV